MDDGLRGIITESEMFERHGARYHIGSCEAALRAFFVFIKEFKHALRGGDGLLERSGDGRELRDRLGEIAHLLDERLDVADFNHLFHRQLTAQDTNDDVANVANKHHHRLHDAGEELRLPRAVT